MGASRSRRAPRSHEVAGLTRSNRSLGVNLSLWRTTAQPGIFEDITCASGTPTARKSWKARFWTIAVAAVQTTVRGLGVTAYGMASAAVASRAVFAVFLAIFLSRGRKKTVHVHGLGTSAAGSPCTTALHKLAAGRGDSGTPDGPRNSTWRQLHAGTRSLKDGARGRSLHLESANGTAV